MKIKEVMTPNVETVDAAATLRACAEKMKSLDVGILPVLEDQRIVGVVTDRDIVIRAVAEGKDAEKCPVRDIMTQEVEIVSDEQEAEEAARLMKRNQIRRVLAVDSNDRLVGMLSLGDLAVHSGDRDLAGEVLERVSEPAKPAR